MCSLSNLGLFWFLEVSMCSREDLQAQKCSFWMISVGSYNLLPAELPLTAENHTFSFRFDPQPIVPTLGNQLILHWKCMFSEVNPLWTSSEHSWGPGIDGVAPRTCQKPSGIMEVDGIDEIWNLRICFKKKAEKYTEQICWSILWSGRSQ